MPLSAFVPVLLLRVDDMQQAAFDDAAAVALPFRAVDRVNVVAGNVSVMVMFTVVAVVTVRSFRWDATLSLPSLTAVYWCVGGALGALDTLLACPWHGSWCGPGAELEWLLACPGACLGASLMRPRPLAPRTGRRRPLRLAAPRRPLPTLVACCGPTAGRRRGLVLSLDALANKAHKLTSALDTVYNGKVAWRGVVPWRCGAWRRGCGGVARRDGVAWCRGATRWTLGDALATGKRHS